MRDLERLHKIKEIENYSGVNIREIHRLVKPLRKGYHEVIHVPLGGDAPKDFIRVYKYGEAFKRDVKNWSKYLAKVGHKWYPIESITEYMLNKLGETLGLKMAKSELRLADEQLRFLSKYFLAPDENLIHGAQIYSTFLNEQDTTFVDEIEEKRMSKELLTFQLTKQAIEFVFPQQSETILENLVQLLVFDAIVGNNDRHFYNWGVITDIRNKKIPVFSPIYDTARGLFWNFNEDKIVRFFNKSNKIENGQFEKYIQLSQPKIGWDGMKKLNHFDLIANIFNNYPNYSVICSDLLNTHNLDAIFEMLNSEFNKLLSKKRFILVRACLQERFNKLNSICIN